MSKRLDWEEISGLALPERNITALTHVGVVLILACSVLYRQRYNWTYGGDDLTDSQWDDIGHTIGRMEHELMSGLVGAILPHVLGSVPDLNLLPCDGSTYLKADYPLLYDAIDPIYIIDATSFRVPDLQDRFPMGESGTRSIDDTGGSETVTLTESEIPSHSHTNAPHSHSEITATPFPTLVGAGAPAVYAVSGVGATGFQGVAIDNTGGGQAHENLPPFLVVRWGIVSG